MPDTITHILFAEKALDRLYKEVDRQAFFIGCIGPDPLFYYNLLSFSGTGNSAAAASKIHHSSGLDIIKKGKEYISNQTDKRNIYILDSYLLGFIAHYILDSEAHPYINSVSAEYISGHKRFEMNIDTLLLEKYKNQKSGRFDFSLYMKPDKGRTEIISGLFNHILKEVWSKDFNEKIYTKSIKDMRIICSLFRDPFKIFRPLSVLVESITGKKGAYRYLFYHFPKNGEPDYMNLSGTYYDKTFPEIFETALENFMKASENEGDETLFLSDFSGKRP